MKVVNTIVLLVCLVATIGKVIGKNGNLDYDYFDRQHEIVNPRTVPVDILTDTVNTAEVVVKYEGYSIAKLFTLSLVDETGKLIARNVKPTKAVILEGGDDTENKLVYKLSTVVKKTALRTLDELKDDLQTDLNLKSYTMKFWVPIKFFPCNQFFLKVNIRLLDPVNWRTYTPFPPIYFPKFCRKCYSYANQLMAHHGQTIANCGGRSCTCYDGTFTCNAQCKRRMAWHTLSHANKNKHVDAVNWLETQEGTDLGFHLGHTSGAANKRSYWKVLSDHLTYSGHAHGNSKFLPWHRSYLCEYEQLLQLYDVCLTLSYWYHPIDSTGSQYHVLNDSYLGDEVSPYGQLNSPWDLPTGFMSFHRGGTNSNVALASASQITTLLSSPDFATYRTSAEGVLHHVYPHTQVSGNMGTYESPADPLFWLHHNMVDRNWGVWRGMSPANAASYDASLAASVSPQWSLTVSDVINETGLFAATTTVYKNGMLPQNDHCALCYNAPYVIIVWNDGSIFKPKRISLDELLARSVPQIHLNVRSPEDPTIALTLKANDITDERVLEDLANNNCQFMLPDEINEFINKFNMDYEIIKQEVCDHIKKPVYMDTPTTLAIPLMEVDANDQCGVTLDRNSTAYVEIHVSEQVLKESLLDTCSDQRPS